jgi:hypothetical protein
MAARRIHAMRPVSLGMVLILLAACATLQPFEPVDVNQTRGPDGYRAAEYDISAGHGDWDNVVVHVWTLGPSREEKTKENKSPHTFMDVSWQITNNSKNAVQLDLTRIRLMLRPKPGAQPSAIAPDPSPIPSVGPGAEHTLQLSFPLPSSIDVELLQSFEVAWALTGDNQSYRQTTRFERPQSRTNVQPSFGIGFGMGL